MVAQDAIRIALVPCPSFTWPNGGKGEMSSNEEAVKLQARIIAIEYAICDLFSSVYKDIDSAEIHRRHDQLVEYFRTRTALGRNPASSDRPIAEEAEFALRELLTLIELHMRMPRPKPVGE
jgi:hypothetical protein